MEWRKAADIIIAVIFVAAAFVAHETTVAHAGTKNVVLQVSLCTTAKHRNQISLNQKTFAAKPAAERMQDGQNVKTFCGGIFTCRIDHHHN